jgi:hypothetical protein
MMKKRQPLQQKLLGKWISTCRKLDPSLSLCISINSKWIKNLNIRTETLKQVQEKAGKTLEAIGIARTSSVELKWSATKRKD